MKTRTSTPKATADTITRLSSEVEAVRSIAGGYDNPSTRRPIYVESVAALKAQSVASLPNGAVFVTKGYYSIGDGGAAEYVYNSASSATDNGGTVIAPTTGSGRYLLQVEDVVNVRQFGAKGDGTTSDSAAIQAAINSIPNGGVVVFPLSSGYLITTEVVVNQSNVTLMGTRRGFRQTGGTSAGTPDIIYNGSGAAIQINAAGTSTCESFLLDSLWFFGGTFGSFATYVGATGLRLGNPSGTYKSAVGRIQDCSFTNFLTNGILVTASSSLIVDGCTFRNNGYGVNVENSGAGSPYNGYITFDGCRWTYHREAAFYDQCVTATQFSRCVWELNEKQAVLSSSPYLSCKMVFDGCHFESNCTAQTGSFWVDLSAGTFANVFMSGNELLLPSATANSAMRIAGTASGTSTVTLTGNNYSNTSGSKKGTIGSNSSNPVTVSVFGEVPGDFSITSGSTVAWYRSATNASFSGIQGAASISAAIQLGAASQYLYLENCTGILLSGGVQYRINGSRTGAQSFAAAAGSTCSNVAPTAGKHQFWACTTGGASPTYASLNAGLCGWQLINSSTPDVTDVAQLKIGGPRTVTNFTGGQDGQMILVLATGGTVTFTASATIVTKSGGDIVLAANQMVRFALNGSAWTEC